MPTGKAEATDNERPRRGTIDPCHAFLEKPFPPQQILARVRALLDSTRDGQVEPDRVDEDVSGTPS